MGVIGFSAGVVEIIHPAIPGRKIILVRTKVAQENNGRKLLQTRIMINTKRASCGVPKWMPF